VTVAPLAFCFGVHNHQPVGNFAHILAEATERAYHPFLERLRARPEIRITAHWTGSLLEWLRDAAPRTFDLLGTLVARGQVELLTGGYYEPILAVLPEADQVGQVEHLTAFLRTHFGVRPRGLWLAERVWEPHLPALLRRVGVEYVLVDDSHFALAGWAPETLGGYYLTEHQGAVVAVFPISQRLRYLVPFADVDAAVAELERCRGRVPAVTLVDDGEKFGVWPGTYAHVYGGGWLDRFFDRLLSLGWLHLVPLGQALDRWPASGRVYLPTASYREMGEWALPVEAAREHERARRMLATLPDGERLQTLLHGGYWRTFLVKYPEVADAYWTMVRLSGRMVEAARTRPGDPRLSQARTALWRGQANDAYWHGVFGGCYLPHLRRAVKGALLEAERLLDTVQGRDAPWWVHEDLDGDGEAEVAVRTAELGVTIRPAAGGMVTELAHRGRLLDLADVLARRPEPYHDRLREPGTGPVAAEGQVRTIHAPPAAKEPGLAAWLAYDDLRRGSLIEGLFRDPDSLDPVTPWSSARVVTARVRGRAQVTSVAGGVEVTMTLAPQGSDLARVVKVLRVVGGRLEARYRVEPDAARGGCWAVQWNLALTGPDGGRYLALPERPALRSRGRRAGVDGLRLVDEWAGLEVELGWCPPADLAWGPVETVSVSEAGFERVYQGSAFLGVWSIPEGSSPSWELLTSLTVTER
jgi:alpha-amylase